MAVGELLCEEKRTRGRIVQLAELLKVTPRTLENWMKLYRMGGNAKVGRPSYTEEEKRAVMIKVGRLYFIEKCRTWRSVKLAAPLLPTRFIQEYVKYFKTWHRKWIEKIKTKSRESTEVLMTNAYWVQDGTHVGRIEKKPVEAQVSKDRGSLKILAIKTGPTSTGKDVVEMLQELKKERGLPLVLGTDNGSCYCNEEVKAYLREEKVVHLLSLPRTPQHNAAAERAMRELKEGTVLGRNTRLHDMLGPHALLVKNAEGRNACLRESKKLKSANELDDTLPDARAIIDRAVFYDEYMQGILMISALKKNAREQRMLEREWILSTLEKYGAIKRTRGGRNYGAECEVFL